jgi:hypothetical protein
LVIARRGGRGVGERRPEHLRLVVAAEVSEELPGQDLLHRLREHAGAYGRDGALLLAKLAGRRGLRLSARSGLRLRLSARYGLKASLVSLSAVSRRAARSITSRNAVGGANLPRVSNSQASASARPFSQPLFIKLPRMHLLRSWWAGAHRCVAMSRLMAMRLARS